MKLTIEQLKDMHISEQGVYEFWGWVNSAAKHSPKIRKCVEDFANNVLEFPGHYSDNRKHFTPKAGAK